MSAGPDSPFLPGETPRRGPERGLSRGSEEGEGSGSFAGAAGPPGPDWEEAAGISAPLYELVDALFELQGRGFFRRQVLIVPPPGAGGELLLCTTETALSNVQTSPVLDAGPGADRFYWQANKCSGPRDTTPAA